ncbi:MAG: amidohydrolase family protein [Alphaproteobacteria bacterium]|jgi:cytosine/adenosine deaminase-related metal-dependent hydrolase
MAATVIRNVSWAVLWDGNQHAYSRDVDVAFDNGAISFIGPRFEGDAAREVDGRDRLLIPGMVNIHTHPTSEPLRKGITDETHSPGFWHSSLYEYLTVFMNDGPGNVAAMEVAMAELLLSGVTTVVDLSVPFDGWLDVLAGSGIRAVAAPMFRDARWYTEDGHELKYEWDTKAGRTNFEHALRLIDLAKQHPSGRLSGMVAPSQIDTCSADLLRDAHDAAAERNLPFQIHAAQSATEFYEMQRRHGLSPIQWMDDLGILSERSIIGHGIFLDHHPWLHWTTRKDLGLLADQGATVAHCPTVFLRRGIALNTFGEYSRRGINLGIGTDTYPHNYLDELRTTLYTARAVGGSVADLSTGNVFDAATIGGAKALGRDDIGRIEVGARADLVMVDLKHPAMMPVREPLRSLIYVAGDRAVRDVFVNGDQVVRDGTVTTIDLAAASQALEDAQQRSMEKVPGRDWAGRDTDTLAPMVLPMMGG